MTRYRLSERAESDIASILAVSKERWGEVGKQRYAEIIVAAMRRAAADPAGRATRSREDLAPGLRSLHLRHASAVKRMRIVKRPVHILYFRAAAPNFIEIVRVLHERMEPSRHLKGIAGGLG
jgi:toxin ParE1/3/4